MNGNDHVNPEDLEEWSDDYSGEGLLPNASSGVSSSGAGDATAPQVLIVEAADSEERLDRFLSAARPGISRSQLQRWVSDGQVLVDGRVVKPSLSLRPGQVVSITPPALAPVNDWIAEPMALDIVFEDDDVIVVNKPAGLVVHPAAGHASGTLVNGLIAHCPAITAVARCGIVHRLDRDTSGLMVAAKTVAAQLSLVNQLAARTVSRQYLALAWGRVADQTLDTAMGRDPRDRQRMAVLPAGKGKQAITHIEALAQGEIAGLPVTLVRCRLETGRTHQIRVHLEHSRHPIVGDRTYNRHSPHASRLDGYQKVIFDLMKGQALHAQRLSFLHPKTDKKSSFISVLPDNYKKLIEITQIPADIEN